jgi:hypothetical protein
MRFYFNYSTMHPGSNFTFILCFCNQYNKKSYFPRFRFFYKNKCQTVKCLEFRSFRFTVEGKIFNKNIKIEDIFKNCNFIIIYFTCKICSYFCLFCSILYIQSYIKVKSTIYWNITPCSPLKLNRRFGGTCLLHLQG